MDTDTPNPVPSDRSCPMMFVVLPAFVGGLIWVCMVLSRMTP
jgi:hypothetical protein